MLNEIMREVDKDNDDHISYDESKGYFIRKGNWLNIMDDPSFVQSN
jgi:hypothetical protein